MPSSNVNTNSRPSDLKITDMRTASIGSAPMRCTIIRIDTNQGLYGLGEKWAATFFDADGDGDLDALLSSKSGQNRLYRHGVAGYENITLLNTTPDAIDLEGWSVADRNKNKADLNGKIGAGETLKILLTGENVQLSNKGGIITLLDSDGLKVDGVSYMKKDASQPGWTIVF